MPYTLANFSYDFGARRVNATIQQIENREVSFITINLPYEPPAGVTAQDLENLVADYIQIQLNEAAKFVKK